MVFTNKYTQVLMDKFPDFAKSNYLKERIEFEADGEFVNIHTVFSGLTDYVVDELIKQHDKVSDEELAIYQFVEEIRVKYSDFSDKTEESDFDGAACTCFLENLINRASAGRFEYSRFIPYLGEKSKEYCRAWDEFTGVKSLGLW